MIHDDTSPATTHRDPPRVRLRGRQSKAAELLEAYAKETRPAQREALASWFRLQRRLNAALDTRAAAASSPGPWSRRWTWRVRVASGVLTAALGVAVLVNVVPSLRAGRGDVGRSSVGSVGAGGASGTVEGGGPGVGGMEGAGGGESESKSERSSGASGSAT